MLPLRRNVEQNFQRCAGGLNAEIFHVGAQDGVQLGTGKDVPGKFPCKKKEK